MVVSPIMSYGRHIGFQDGCHWPTFKHIFTNNLSSITDGNKIQEAIPRFSSMANWMVPLVITPDCRHIGLQDGRHCRYPIYLKPNCVKWCMPLPPNLAYWKISHASQYFCGMKWYQFKKVFGYDIGQSNEYLPIIWHGPHFGFQDDHHRSIFKQFFANSVCCIEQIETKFKWLHRGFWVWPIK